MLGVHYWYWVTKINIDFILGILHTVPVVPVLCGLLHTELSLLLHLH